MSLLSLSEAQSAGEPTIGTKAVESILGEPSLFPEGFSSQQRRGKPSHSILDIDATPMEICCAKQILIPEFEQFNEKHFGNGRSRGLASDQCRTSGENPIGIHVIGELLPKIVPPQLLQGNGELRSEQEGNAFISKAYLPKFERDHLLSNNFSNMKDSFSKEKICIDSIRHVQNKELCFLFDSKNGKRSRYRGGGKLESEKSLFDLGKDELILEGCKGNEINKSKGIMTNDSCTMTDTSSSQSEDNGFPTKNACRAGFEKSSLTAEDIHCDIQKMEEIIHEGVPKNLGNLYLDEHQTLPLWVKWRGKWQTGFRCPTIDCPLSTLRAKPTHERKKYVLVFFPRTRTYSWVDILLVCPIEELPEPLAYGTHRRWKKLVNDLSIPRRYIMQKLAVAMLNISDQLHTEAVVEDARRTIAWKEFAMEAARCRAYPGLGKMLLKLQKMILPLYISKDWLESSFDYWMQKCRTAPSAESIEILTEEIVESVLWSKVDELWNAPMQPELGPEWKTWKQEAMRWFFASHVQASLQAVENNTSVISVKEEPQTSRKRVKLEIRRPETSASKIEVLDCKRLSCIKSLDNNCRHDISEDRFKMPLNCEPNKMSAFPGVVAAATGSGNMLDRGNDTALEGKGAGHQSTDSTSANGRRCKELMMHAPVQSDSSNRYRQCLAFIEAKGRQCGRWANDGDIYCCVHLTFHSDSKNPQINQMLPIEAPMCQGTTTHGNKCKHRARYNSTFCKKHWFQGNQSSVAVDTLLLSSDDTSQRTQLEGQVPENLSSSNATNGHELSLVRESTSSAEENLIPIIIEETLDERNCLMKQSELYNALPIGNGISEIQHCIGHYSHSNGGHCQEFPRRHTLYCEKHLPRFLKRARNGKSRLISKDIFINLLKNCSSRKQKLCLHHACELLYGFLKSGLSCQKFLSRDDNVAWIISEASKDMNVAEHLLKLVTCEREKIMRLWGLNCDLDKHASSKEINSLATMNQDSQKTLKCKMCYEEFSDDHMLVKHWTEIHKKEARRLFKGYACAACMNLFTNRKVLETHVIEKHGVQCLEHSIVVRCVSCSSQFVSPDKLWQHVFSFHLTELRLPDFSPSNCSLLEDKATQTMARTTLMLCQNKSVLEKDEDSRKYICRFCGLKFDRLPDLGRHHQIAHMIPHSTSHFSSKRRNYFLKHSKSSRSRFWKKIGPAFRFKNQSNRVMIENFQSSNSVPQVKPKLCKQPSEVFGFGGLSESNCCSVAETLFSKIQRTKQRLSNLEILSFARSACCRISLDAALVEYGVLPRNIYLKAAKLCSELNVQVGWHQEGFICPRGCTPVTEPYSLAPLNSLPSLAVEPPKIESRSDVKWEIDECHYILSAKHFDWKRRDSIVLCKDVSFGKEAIPVACVVDEDLKHLLTTDVSENSCNQKPWLSMPWLGYTYATERLIDPCLGLDSKSSQLGCACPQLKCYPENCDHVYLFNNDYDNAVDIYGNTMQGRFPYDDEGRILLEEGYLVYECNSMCSCDMTCKNRILQKGIQVKLEIFRTEKKGWAVRAGEVISRGAFVCEYIGVLNTSGTHKRGQSYLYDIDAHIDSASGLSEGTVPCVIDATKYGNVSRFINHSCSPNLVNYLVLVESMDCQLAHVGLFANRDIALGEELAYDYRSKLLPGEGLRCHCEAPCCRGVCISP